MNWYNQFHSSKKSADLSSKFRAEGNSLYTKKHNDGSHMQVLLLYTKSIAFAPENSEELALGYGNRSALLLHVHKYEECNIDIDKALSISKSDDLKAKLFSRKATCFKLIAESSYDFNAFEKIDLPKISKSEKVPCVAKNLTLNNNEKYGKHFVTNKEINPGEIIALEEAYISFPLMSKLYLVCSYCLAQSWNGIPCKFCTESIYCSESCKSKAWEEYHEIECYIITNISPLSQVSNPQSQQIYRAALRLFIKTVKSHTIEGVVKDVKKHDFEIFNGIFSCHQFQSIYNLATNGPTEDSSNKRSFVKTVMKFLSKNNNIFTDKVKSYFESEKKMLTFVEQLLSRLISIIDINSYQVEDYRNKCNCKNHNHKIATCGMRGLILVPCCSLFNHNCVPNVEWFFWKK